MFLNILPCRTYTKVQILSACLPVSLCCSFMEFQCGCLNSYVKLKTSNLKCGPTPADAELMSDAVRERQRWSLWRAATLLRKNSVLLQRFPYFSVHGALWVSAVICTEPLGQKKYLALEVIKQLSPNNNYRLTLITDSVTTFCKLDFCFPRKFEISRGALGHHGSQFGNRWSALTNKWPLASCMRGGSQGSW
jgi:hypothetical protein